MTVLNVRAAKAALRVWEVPSYECRRIHGESSLHALRDGIRVFRKIWSECPAICARYTDAMRPPLRRCTASCRYRYRACLLRLPR